MSGQSKIDHSSKDTLKSPPASVDSIIKGAMESKDFLESARVAHAYSIDKYIERDFAGAIKYAKKEIEIFEYAKIETIDYINALFNLAFFYQMNAEYLLSISVYKKIIEKNIDSSYVSRSYGGIGENHNHRGDHIKAIEFIKKSILGLEEIKDYRSILSQKFRLSNVYLKLEDSINALKGLEVVNEINQLQEKIAFSEGILETMHRSYANFYSILGEKYFEKAKYHYFKSVEINKRSNDSLGLGSVYSSLSYLYNKKRIDSSGFYAKRAIGLLRSDLDNLSVAYENFFDYLLIKEKYEQLLDESDKIIDLNLKRKKIEGEVSDEDLYSVVNKENVFFFFNQRIKALYGLYKQKNNQALLSKILLSVHKADLLVSLIYEVSTDNFTKLYWRKEASQAYLYGAYAAHLLGDPEKAFSFMEKNKALLLSESVLKNTEFANLPKHISDEDTSRKRQIYELENGLSKDEENVILQDSLFNAKVSYEKYVDSLKTIYPKYFARKINVDQVSLADMQRELASDEALVSFIWNDFDRDTELVIGLLATQDTSITFELKRPKEIRTKIQEYRNYITKPFETKQDQESFQNLAYEIYRMIFPSEEIQNMIKGKNLMIIPDGDLQNIPFESLITKENSKEYLILNGDINYSYSYSFLKHNEKIQRQTTETFTGYSPIDFSDSNLSSLNNSEEELKEVNARLNGSIKLQDTATKENFLNTSSNVKIIHLATHADAGKNPWIAFADDKLELHELYTYKNNADLVTLSACNTSLGEMAKGEGVLSLARGFFHSGSKSVVSSLWEVNDKSTSEIMTNFYENLKEGQSKSEAINNAKRTYLSNHSLSEQSPYYWSSFILIGDPGAIDLPSNNYLYLIVISLIIIVLMLFRKKIKIFG